MSGRGLLALSAWLLCAQGCGELLVGVECEGGDLCGPLELSSIRSEVLEIYPGQIDIKVVATVRNRSASAVGGISLGLTFKDATLASRDAELVARQAKAWSRALGPGETAAVEFSIEVAPFAVAQGEVWVDGELTYEADRTRFVAHARSKLVWRFAPMNEELVVDTPLDLAPGEDDALLSLRRALALANERPGIDRIVFAQHVFGAGEDQVITLRSDLPDLPALEAEVDPLLLVADGVRVAITLDAGFDGSRRVPFRIHGSGVIYGLYLREMSRLVEASSDCIEGPEPGMGAAVVVFSGEQAVVRANHFMDAGLAERPCTSTLVAVQGGGGHLIADNVFEDSPADAISVMTAPVRVRENRVVRGRDDGIVVKATGGTVHVEGNLVAGASLAGLMIYEGSDVEAIHNTFVRTSCHGIQALAPSRLWLRNNAYLGIAGSAIAASDKGANIDAAFEATDSSVYCYDCTATTIDAASMIIGVALAVANPEGASFEDMTPSASSLLLDAGLEVSDRNGSAPGRHNGARPERGAVELP